MMSRTCNLQSSVADPVQFFQIRISGSGFENLDPDYTCVDITTKLILSKHFFMPALIN